MKIVMLAIIAMSLVGCSSINYTHHNPDGSTDAITSNRFFWASEGITASVSTNGASLVVSKSNTDNAAIAAAAEGIVKGMVASSKP